MATSKEAKRQSAGEDALRLWRAQFTDGEGRATNDFSPSIKGSTGWSKKKISVKKR
jgi:hypothetical protein